MAEMTVRSPFGEGKIRTRVRLYAGLPRVEIDTELVNQQPFVRYRNVFPLNLCHPSITYEIPFGAITRPEGEYPAQNAARALASLALAGLLFAPQLGQVVP
jgi:alpha-mannosidase